MADEPVSSDPPTPPTDAAPAADAAQAADAAPAAPAVPPAPNPIATAWSELDQTSRMIIGSSIVLAIALLFGALVGAWYASGTFQLIMLLAAVAAAATAWYTSTTNAGPKPSPLPLATVEFAAGAVATVLGALRVLEMVFDLDDLEDFGGPIGALLTIVVAIAAAAILAGAFRRDPSFRTPRRYGDTSTRLAVSGLTLVIIGWALNLSIGFWTMSAASSSVGLLTIAAIAIIVAPRWATAIPEVPLAWVGAGLAAVGLLLTAGLWGDLLSYGSTRVVLGIMDFVPFLLLLIGIIVVIVAGALGGRPWLAARQARTPKPAPTAETPAADAPAAETPADVTVPTQDAD